MIGAIFYELNSPPPPLDLYCLEELKKRGIERLAILQDSHESFNALEKESLEAFDNFILIKDKKIIKTKKVLEEEKRLALEALLEGGYNSNKELLFFLRDQRFKGSLPKEDFYKDLLNRKLVEEAEIWEAIDEDEKSQGFQLVRNLPIPRGSYHLVVEILVRHTTGDYLIMRRALSKNKAPGLWEASASGSALVGEGSLEAARRELEEETGIDRGELSYLSRQVYPELGAIFHNYLCITDYDKEKITLQEGETIDYSWLSKKELQDFLTSDKAISWQKRRYQDLAILF